MIVGSVTNYDPVKLRGETLSEICWRGKQWAVTSYGIERLDGTYFIEAKRLLEDLHDYPWPLHMAAKGRVDAEEFTTAWMVAILLHGQGRRVDAKAIYETIAKLPPIAEAS